MLTEATVNNWLWISWSLILWAIRSEIYGRRRGWLCRWAESHSRSIYLRHPLPKSFSFIHRHTEGQVHKAADFTSFPVFTPVTAGDDKTSCTSKDSLDTMTIQYKGVLADKHCWISKAGKSSTHVVYLPFWIAPPGINISSWCQSKCVFSSNCHIFNDHSSQDRDLLGSIVITGTPLR